MVDSQQFLFRCNPEPMWIYDRETLAFLAVNEAAVRLYGYSETEFMAMTLADIRPPEDVERLRTAVGEAAESPSHRGRWRHITREGQRLVVEVRTFGFDYEGRAAEIVAIKDVTELARLEAADAEARRSQQSALELLGRAGRVARFGGWRMELETDVVTWSDETAAIHDSPPGLGLTLQQALSYYAVEDQERLRSMVERCRREGEAFDEVLRIVTARGRRIWIRLVGAAERDRQGRIIGLSGACQDINELVEARNRSESLEHRLREILDATGEGFMVLGADWRIAFINRSAALMLRRSTEDLLHKVVWDEFPEAVGSLFQQKYQEAWETGGSVVFEAFYERLGWFEVRAYPSREGLAVHFQNVTARKRAQMELEASEERFRLVASGTSDVIWDFDFASGRGWWSEQMARRYGHDIDVAARHPGFWLAHVHADDRVRVKTKMETAIRDGASGWTSAYRFVRRDGGVAHVMDRAFILRDDDGAAVRMLGNMTDVTERVEFETRLQEAQKFEALGRLTGGVAHDFNNLLTIIMGSSEELLARAVSREEQELAQLNIVAASQGADLIRRLLAIARRQPLEARTVEAGLLLEELEPILRRSVPAEVDLVTTVAPDVCPIHVDPSQLQAALLNLVLNARDAIVGDGRIVISVTLGPPGIGPGETKKEDAVDAAAPVPGYVAISVTDTGCGMTPEVQRQVFEPFFTTKAMGRGSGLGSSMVHGFVTQSQGRIELESRPGHGTKVTLLLPCAQELGDEVTAAHPAIPVRSGGKGRILVVEDDPLVRAHVGRRLEAAGYATVCAPDSHAALDLLAAEEEFDLLFTDLIMPGGMDGRELARDARRRHPHLKVLFTSGYEGETDGGSRDEMDTIPLLRKPYRQSALITEIHKILSAP